MLASALVAATIAAACTASSTVTVDDASDMDDGAGDPIATSTPAPAPSPTAAIAETPTSPPATTTPLPTPTAAPTPNVVPFPAPTDGFGELVLLPGPSVTCTPVPDDTTTVWFAPLWETGDVRELIQYSRRDDTRLPTPSGFSETNIRLEVLATSDRTTTYDWQAAETDVSSLGLPPQWLSQFAPLLEELPPLHVVYRLDDSIQLEEVENIAEVRATVGQMLSALADEFPEVDEIAGTFGALPDDSFGLLFAQDVLLLHTLEGFELTEGELIELDDLLVNPFGGSDLPAQTRLELTDLADDDGCVRVEVTTELDAALALPILLDSMAIMLGVDAIDTAEVAEVAETFVIWNSSVGQYDYETGFFKSVVVEKRSGDSTQARQDSDVILDVTDNE